MSNTPANPLLTIRTTNAPTTRINLSFDGPDRDKHYDLNIVISDDTGDIEHAADGVPRPGCAFVLGGLDDDENAKEVRLFRAFGEDDLRWLAKACLEAAYKLRRIENARRKRAAKPAPASEERGG